MSRKHRHAPAPTAAPAAAPSVLDPVPVPVPAMTPPTEQPSPGGRSVAYVWAFRAFALFFLLTLLAGLLNYLGMKFFK